MTSFNNERLAESTPDFEAPVSGDRPMILGFDDSLDHDVTPEFDDDETRFAPVIEFNTIEDEFEWRLARALGIDGTAEVADVDGRYAVVAEDRVLYHGLTAKDVVRLSENAPWPFDDGQGCGTDPQDVFRFVTQEEAQQL